MTHVSHLLTFAATLPTLYAAHSVGDHWLQRTAEALGKGGKGWRGRLLCAKHVAILTAAKLVALVTTAAFVGLPLSPVAVAAGLTIDAASHYWADRRTTLAALARATGNGELYDLGDVLAAPTGTGAYALDQSWHIAWLWVAALVIAAL